MELAVCRVVEEVDVEGEAEDDSDDDDDDDDDTLEDDDRLPLPLGLPLLILDVGRLLEEGAASSLGLVLLVPLPLVPPLPLLLLPPPVLPWLPLGAVLLEVEECPPVLLFSHLSPLEPEAEGEDEEVDDGGEDDDDDCLGLGSTPTFRVEARGLSLKDM